MYATTPPHGVPLGSSQREIPVSWNTFDRGTFHSDLDSLIFSRGLETENPHAIKSILDLGCGSARPALGLVKYATYVGIDIDEKATMYARGNLAKVGASDGSKIINSDVRTLQAWRSELPLSIPWDLVAANLPYLPTEQPNILGREVDGGRRGTDLVPNSVLEIARHLAARRIVLNISSLCDLDFVGHAISKAGYGVVRVVATVAELEEYAQTVLDYLKRVRRLRNAEGFVRLYQRGSEWRQIIFAVELVNGEGAPFDLMFTEAEKILSPDADSSGKIIVGSCSWRSGHEHTS